MDNEGGAAKAAFRLFKGLRNIGVESRLLVGRKSGEDENVIGSRTKFARGFSIVRSILDSLPLAFYRKRSGMIFSPSLVPDSITKNVSNINPDIVHLHWVAGGFLRIETLKRLRKPLVWTLHDSWAFTGGCHIPFECKRYKNSCGKCPELGSENGQDLSHQVWKRKKRAWKQLSLTVVTPSRWLADCARSSSLFRNMRIEVIPNGLDIDKFKPIGGQAMRELLSLPVNKKMILFGAMSGTADKNKGFHFLVSALQRLTKNGWGEKVELIVFGSSDSKIGSNLGVKTHYMGHLRDEISVAMLYLVSDVFVLPSIQENLPNTIMEALACGTPCVAFDIGGISDLIEHEGTGYLAQPFEIDDLARGIEWILTDNKRYQSLSLNARRKVEKEFDIRRVSRRYMDLYNEILT